MWLLTWKSCRAIWMCVCRCTQGNPSLTCTHSYNKMCLCVFVYMPMHLWMHTGAWIILTQLGSTSPSQPICACACVRSYQLRPLCWSSKPLSHSACIISPQSYWSSNSWTHAHSYKPIFTLTFMHIITFSHKLALTCDIVITYHGCFKLLAIKHMIHNLAQAAVTLHLEGATQKQRFCYFQPSCWIRCCILNFRGQLVVERTVLNEFLPITSTIVKKVCRSRMLLNPWVRNNFEAHGQSKVSPCKGHLQYCPIKPESRSCVRSKNGFKLYLQARQTNSTSCSPLQDFGLSPVLVVMLRFQLAAIMA